MSRSHCSVGVILTLVSFNRYVIIAFSFFVRPEMPMNVIYLGV